MPSKLPDGTLPLALLTIQPPLPSCCGSDRGYAVPAARRAPAPVPQRKTAAATCHCRPFLPSLLISDKAALSNIDELTVPRRFTGTDSQKHRREKFPDLFPTRGSCLPFPDPSCSV